MGLTENLTKQAFHDNYNILFFCFRFVQLPQHSMFTPHFGSAYTKLHANSNVFFVLYNEPLMTNFLGNPLSLLVSNLKEGSLEIKLTLYRGPVTECLNIACNLSKY